MKLLKELYKKSNGIVDFEPLKSAIDNGGLSKRVQTKNTQIIISFLISKKRLPSNRKTPKKIPVTVLKELVKLDQDLKLYYGDQCVDTSITNESILINVYIE